VFIFLARMLLMLACHTTTIFGNMSHPSIISKIIDSLRQVAI
jgi:hypothetical protein